LDWGEKKGKKERICYEFLICCELLRSAANFAACEVLSHSVRWSHIESKVPGVCPVSVTKKRYHVHGVCLQFNAQQVDCRGDNFDLYLEVVRLESRSGRWLNLWMLVFAFRSVCRETEPKYEYKFVQRSVWLLTKVFI
jgi:hypothetical protein